MTYIFLHDILYGYRIFYFIIVIIHIMKKKQQLFLHIILSFVITCSIVYWADVVSEELSRQEGTLAWASKVIVTNEPLKPTTYINAGNNSTVIWNYLAWYYYDSIFWYFRLDWSNDKSKNVRIIESTERCTTGYGYKLWGKAKSSNSPSGEDTAWYIDFDYSDSTFVYYCESDQSLHWKAYSETLWFQDFEWIWFQIITEWNTEFSTGASNVFVNDTSQLDTVSSGSYSIDTILWEQFKFDTSEESIFYIFK